MPESDPQILQEAARRRTFAIISHPDAGKTTMTEKLLLFGGCIDVAGAVRGRKTQRTAASDWMELEKQRGISVSSTVLAFDFEDHRLNLLDTPGHHDFSEDTYRTLMAADCAVMVIDLAKGVETQTEKLFQVCKLRRIPVLTFVNKVDRPGREPLAILGEIESKLGIEPAPANWPLGIGPDFCGLVELGTRTAHFFDERNNDSRIGFRSQPWDAVGEGAMRDGVIRHAREEIELLGAAGTTFERSRFLAGEITPVFFGSALTNYGIEHFLQAFLELCPPPGARSSDCGLVPTAQADFTGFVFKIQANLDPRHRDRIAFVRVCSGKFRREMEVFHPRTGKKLKLRRAHRLFGQERETVDEAFPGDIVGLVNPGEFHLGDTLCEGAAVNFDPLPQFSPEHFAVLRCPDTGRRKQFGKGMAQLIEEGAIQVFANRSAVRREPILAAVGELQFDVVRFRLESEYNSPTEIEWLPYKLARWVSADAETVRNLKLPYAASVVEDQLGNTAVLFSSRWEAEYCQRENPEVEFSAIRSSSRKQAVDSAQALPLSGKLAS